MPYKNELQKESGVALLFALGILSLLLVLGLAFASNALLAQKVAANNSNRSQAKLLAQSAISRITIAMMYYQAQAAQQSPPVIPLNYSDVYSYGRDGQSESGNIFADGLYSTSDSLLKPPASLAAVMTDSTTYAKPKWTFIYDKPLPSSGTSSSATRKIIGRIAYQQVITPAQSKISLYNVLLGIDPQDTPPRVPWDNRWGQTIDELNLDQTTPLNDWGNKAPGSSGDPLDTSNLTLFFDRFSGSGQYFYKYNVIGTAGFVNKKFIERWFTSGTEPTEPEFYRFDISSTDYKFLHRFNLGKLDECDLGEDKWYYRFHKNTGVTLDKNGPGILTNLAADGNEFKLTDELTPSTTGIPFLKQIADTKETFASLADRRKQIAANLNDYCDPDSIPTSDVPADNWPLDEGEKEPTFTGNERTPYIYELGYRLAIHQGDATKTAGIAAEPNGSIKFQLDLYPAVKLAQIYKDIPGEFTSFTFKNSVREITLEGKITGATYTGIKYEYTDDATRNPQSATVNIQLPVSGHPFEQPAFSYIWNSESTNVLHAPADTDNSLTFTPPLGNYPFQAADMAGANRWYGDYQSEADFLKTDEKYLKEIVQAQTGNKPTNIVSGPTSITVNKVEITKIAVKRGPLLLQGTYSDSGSGDSTFGVDYVRSPASALKSTETITFSDTATDADEKSFKFLLGGIRGIDPRQNLNDNDWVNFARVARGDSNWEEVMCVSNASGTITGLANKQWASETAPVHPFDPGATTDTSKYDLEKKVAANGPAWGDDTSHLSTAYIRNAPMQSLWELGVIHRGAAWQTLNLKAAGAPGGTGSISPSDMKQGLSWDNPSGTSYANGDGGILEQVKLTENAYCYGKVNINMLCSDTTINIGYEHAHDYQMGQALFYNIMYGQEISNFETTTSSTKIGVSTTIGNALAQACVNEAGTKKPFSSRTQFLDWELSSGNDLCNAFGAIDITNSSDAQREEIVGKTINLIKAEPSPPNVIQFIVVAQTIRDVGGTIVKINPDDGAAVSLPCSLGSFDAYRYKNNSESTSATDSGKANQNQDDYLYFDEITGEVKMLVTLEKITETTGQLVVTGIQYLD